MLMLMFQLMLPLSFILCVLALFISLRCLLSPALLSISTAHTSLLFSLQLVFIGLAFVIELVFDSLLDLL